jgi:hypothetical protein
MMTARALPGAGSLSTAEVSSAGITITRWLTVNFPFLSFSEITRDSEATFAEYALWIEYFPLNEQVVENVLNPGGEVEVWAWISNSTGHNGSSVILNNGGYGWFYVLSGGFATGYTSIKTPTHDSSCEHTAFTGSTVEWIVENPNNGQQSLSQFEPAQMTNLFAEGLKGASHSYLTDPYVVLNMVGTSDTMCAASINSSGDVDYTWENPQ